MLVIISTQKQLFQNLRLQDEQDNELNDVVDKAWTLCTYWAIVIQVNESSHMSKPSKPQEDTSPSKHVPTCDSFKAQRASYHNDKIMTADVVLPWAKMIT